MMCFWLDKEMTSKCTAARLAVSAGDEFPRWSSTTWSRGHDTVIASDSAGMSQVIR